MSKKKKNKQKQNKKPSLLTEVDKNLNNTHEDLLKEIQDMQIRLSIADQKARKIAKKMAKKKNTFCDFKTIQKETRLEVVNSMESNNLLDRVFNVLKDLTPIVVIIARLISSLILSILSLDFVKIHIKPKTLEKMNKIYNTAMAIH